MDPVPGQEFTLRKAIPHAQLGPPTPRWRLSVAVLLLLENTHPRIQLRPGVLTGARHRLAQSLRYLGWMQGASGVRGAGDSVPWQGRFPALLYPTCRPIPTALDDLAAIQRLLLPFGARTSFLKAITAQNGPIGPRAGEPGKIGQNRPKVAQTPVWSLPTRLNLPSITHDMPTELFDI